jgi:hypothetical protein
MSVIYFKFDGGNRRSLDRDVLGGLEGHRLGIIASESKEEVVGALQQAGVLDLIDQDLIVRRSDDPEATFSEAAARARVTRDDVYYVDEDRYEIGQAAGSGVHAVRDPSRIALAAVAPPKVDISGIAACFDDVHGASLNNAAGPAEETNFDRLLQRLDAAKARLSPLYVDAAQRPFAAKLSTLGSNGFTHILATDANTTTLLQDIAHSILQNGERFEDIATDAFEEVVTDLYDGFLSAEDRKGIKKPERAVLPPLVKWGNPESGPYTWPIDSTGVFDLECAVVNMPPANAKAGLMAWAALSHETAGHDILHANHGLEAELADAVRTKLLPLKSGLADYWSSRIDETASDVMGILNMGPAPAIGVIVFFRGLLAAFGQPPKLRNNGPVDDPHPADIVRGYLGAATVRQLSFTGAAAWANAIDKETDKDVAGPSFQLGGVSVSKAKAKQSAQIAAEVIATHKCEVLGKHALIEIQDWRDADEDIVKQIMPALVTANGLPASVTGAGIFAAHVVAAGVLGALAGKGSPAAIFNRMITVLKSMHDGNPAWGPLRVLHPSSIFRDMAYMI